MLTWAIAVTAIYADISPSLLIISMVADTFIVIFVVAAAFGKKRQ